ncbi:MAG TPA: hypothetical protein DEP01_02940 [Aminobacterium sp.]|uniref:hypothetical protein n=1 Tax=Aminobacterium TaxID=81466 RepID=UPI000EE8A776|nr:MULTISPECIES: hypothetical protein [unclassified Aminobacterium]HCA40546.1 hypothetical protein [Aminobacterium sp.]
MILISLAYFSMLIPWFYSFLEDNLWMTDVVDIWVKLYHSSLFGVYQGIHWIKTYHQQGKEWIFYARKEGVPPYNLLPPEYEILNLNGVEVQVVALDCGVYYEDREKWMPPYFRSSQDDRYIWFCSKGRKGSTAIKVECLVHYPTCRSIYWSFGNL